MVFSGQPALVQAVSRCQSLESSGVTNPGTACLLQIILLNDQINHEPCNGNILIACLARDYSTSWFLQWNADYGQARFASGGRRIQQSNKC